jgi:6-phosphogluconolactonase
VGGKISQTDFSALTLRPSNGSAVSVHPLSETGLIGEASFLFKYSLTQPGPGTKDRQIQSNPHEAIFGPSGQSMFVPDRGADRLHGYYVAGPYSVSQVLNVTLPPSTGLRRITFRTFNCTGTYMYLVSELDNTVRVFTLGSVSNSISDTLATSTPKLEKTLQQTIPTPRLGVNRTAPNNHHLTADITLSNDGKFAYVSNRDTMTYAADTLAIFSVNPDPRIDHAHLTYLGQNATYGKIPRYLSMSLDPQTRYAAVANEVSQSLLILECDQSGFTGAASKLLSLLAFLAFLVF